MSPGRQFAVPTETGEHANMSETEITLSRRSIIASVSAAAAFAATGAARAQPRPAAPPTTITTPPRDFGPNGAPTTYFTDPDIVIVDPSFENIIQANTSIQRLWTGALWAEGPAWSAQGRYLLFS